MNLRKNIISRIFCITMACCAWASATEFNAASPALAVDALSKAKSGDTIILADGLYHDAKLLFRAQGTAALPIVFRSQTPGGARFTGMSQILFGGTHVRVSGFVFDQARTSGVVTFRDAQNCVLEDCAFIECGPATSTGAPIVALRGRSQNNLVTRCYMRGNLSIGMTVMIRTDDCENTHNTFSWNYYKDIIRRSSNGQEAVQIGQGGFSDRTSQYAVVEHCLFEKANGDAEIISNKSSDNTYRYNTFVRCGAMLVLRGGDRARVEGNFLLGNSGGIRVHGSGHIIVNNHIQDCSRDGIYLPSGARHYGPVNSCVIAHNTIINCGRYGIHLGQPNTHPSTTWRLTPTFNDFIGNLIVGQRGTLVRDDGSHVTSWRGNVVWATGDAKPGLE
ncbi:MAG: polysaccharide lyase 6 family protein, partial [Lentisphaeria bacterium]|nr:polysaccharide lyase 6 family protein [Lentisphaeria bacterium]